MAVDSRTVSERRDVRFESCDDLMADAARIANAMAIIDRRQTREQVMPDKRQHRGPHPQDAELFHQTHWPTLQAAVTDLSWLLTRDYSLAAAIKLVGDRYSLRKRQRLAVQRSACSDQSLSDRYRRQVDLQALANTELGIDGFNLLMTVEAALSGAVIIAGRDGCFRDMASVHGSFRLVQETLPALQLIGEFLQETRPASVHWLLDSPVSNSGRLAAQIRQVAVERGWNWSVRLVTDPDPVLQQTESIVCSADSVVLDRCGAWCNLGRQIILDSIADFNLVPLGG